MPMDTNQNINFILKQNAQFLNKLVSYHEVYFAGSDYYSDLQVENVRKTLEAVLFKHTLILVHLEVLWQNSEKSRTEILRDYENSIVHHKWNDVEKMMNSLELESFLFQVRAFLNIYQIYCSQVLGNTKILNKTKEFYSYLDNTDGLFKVKSERVKKYFCEVVYVKHGWGDLTKSLRDRIAHYDFIRYNYEGNEIVHDVLLDWPTLKGLTYERFGQDVANGIFYMITNVSEILYDVEWQSR